MAVCIGLSPPKGATQIQENDTIIGGCGSKRMYSGEDSDLGCQKRHRMLLDRILSTLEAEKHSGLLGDSGQMILTNAEYLQIGLLIEVVQWLDC